MARYTRFRVWGEARALLRAVSRATSEVRMEGDLKAQMRRAAISVASNIAEGAERGSDREFARFLRIAMGSAAEVEAQVMIAEDCGCIAAADALEIAGLTDSIGRMLNGLVARLSSSG